MLATNNSRGNIAGGDSHPERWRQSHWDLKVLCMERRHTFVDKDSSEGQGRVQRKDHPANSWGETKRNHQRSCRREKACRKSEGRWEKQGKPRFWVKCVIKCIILSSYMSKLGEASITVWAREILKNYRLLCMKLQCCRNQIKSLGWSCKRRCSFPMYLFSKTEGE